MRCSLPANVSRSHGMLALACIMTAVAWEGVVSDSCADDTAGLTQTARQATEDGYRGIWYSCTPQNDEFRFKYSGGLGTYCAKHLPLAYYSGQANKTFFCYGGTLKGSRALLAMVSYYDHATGMVPQPTLLMNKATSDAHDNPVLMLDDAGYVWVFVSAHGTARPAYIYKGRRPYSVDAFDLKLETNFSYPQPWFIDGKGFLLLHTRYLGGRFLYSMTSPDGIRWSEPKQLARTAQGHYQVSWRHGRKVGTAFNYHPPSGGLEARTNLYYFETEDFAETFKTIRGELLDLPLDRPQNKTLVHDYEAERLLVYMKDINFDARGNPIILYVTSRGNLSGPRNDPRTWTTAHWTGSRWRILPAFTSDSNYDTGCLHVEADGAWRVIAPSGTGAQPYNPGGEMALWTSTDQGLTWTKVRMITHDSVFNHSYARKPVNAHPDFYALWADGHGREPSESRLYFCDRDGRAFRLPPKMTGETQKPAPLDD